MFRDTWNSKVVRLGPKRQNEVIKRQLSGKHPDPVGDRYLPSRKIYGFDVPIQNGYTPNQFAKRIADVGRFEIAGCHLVQHRVKRVKLSLLTRMTSTSATPCRGPTEASRGLYAGESAPQDSDPCFSLFPLISCTMFKYLKFGNVVGCHSHKSPCFELVCERITLLLIL